MEECKIEKSSIKRSQKDSEPESAESKRVRIVEEAVFNSPELYRVNLEANPHFSGVGDLDASLGLYSLEAKHIREDILDILDDQQTLTDRVPEVQDLNSVMKSLEEEIVLPPWLPLEASDDELGLPPTVSSFDDYVNAKIDLPKNVAGSENELPSYDSFEYGMNVGNNHKTNTNDEFVMVDGLFDYQELLEFLSFPRRAESLPA
ncbi:hypothetical protein HAX54_018592 [Datura stramonium]|uniref:Uncharacterized protein n=1 Tax=Datura stramonium TaxID=4076 RepID=A0ABS8UPM2_DATST|nr:hypothetical protein [Datura stramonium]